MRFRCASAGITHQTLLAWRKQGGYAREKAARGEKLTPNERQYARFLNQMEKAEEEAVAVRLGCIQGAADGGWVKTKTVVKTNAAGEVVEEVTTTETVAPEWTAAAWQLERQLPNEFGRRMAVTGADGAPLVPKEDRADTLASSLEAYLAGVDDGKHLEVESV